MLIQTVGDIQRLVREGFRDWESEGHVRMARCEWADLLQFCYTQKAQIEGNWTPFERMSRGLILSGDGLIVARPFDKFFNWGEGDRTTSAPVVRVTEKVDGSLGIVYHSDGWRVATKGSFDSEQAQWATRELRGLRDLDALPRDATALVEIVYPDNRIIVDYGQDRALVLLAVRRFDGGYWPWPSVVALAGAIGFRLPRVFPFEKPEEIAAACTTLDKNSEGWVVEFADGQRFKFKGEEYRRLHRLISGLSFKNTLTAVREGQIETLRETVPEEFRETLDGWIAEIRDTVVDVTLRARQAFEAAPRADRKVFAEWTMANHKPLSSYLFAMLDGKPVEPIVYKREFKAREEAETCDEA